MRIKTYVIMAPAACALTSVLSSARRETSSEIAPTSTALSLPSKGKLQKKMQNCNYPVHYFCACKQTSDMSGCSFHVYGAFTWAITDCWVRVRVSTRLLEILKLNFIYLFKITSNSKLNYLLYFQ